MDSDKVAGAISTFSANFINELDSNTSVVSSPLSLEFILGLLTLGCEDPSHQELVDALGLSDDKLIKSAFSAISSKVMAVKGVTLNVANKVYIMEGQHELKSELKKDAIDVFNADLEKINFALGAQAASTINKWVESKTNNRIKDLLPGDCLDATTRLVLVNALYFKGTWKKKFDAELTMERQFFLSEGNSIQVPMMHIEDHFQYGVSKELGVTYLEMMYQGEESSMVIILPDEIDGLKAVVDKLAAGYNLMSDLKKLRKTKVQVTVPKFKIETTIELDSILKKLGVSSIFSQQGSGMTKFMASGEELYVSKAIQKAFIEVNEEGAEAAAATGMVLMMRCMPMDRFHFVADRPFLYMLLTGDRIPLFTGIYRGDA